MEKFRTKGGHIVATFGKNYIPKPLAIARCLGIPTFVVFDGDSDAEEKYRDNHEIDNKLILKVCGYAEEEALPEMTLWKDDLVMWHSDIGKVVQSEIDDWKKYEDLAFAEYGNPGGLKKNSLAIAFALERAWEDDQKSVSLEKLCQAIGSFDDKT